MPGPGPHLMYAMGTGAALGGITDGKFSPHHTLVYAINAFFGPDIGSFVEWLASFSPLGSSVEKYVHDPIFYPILLGLPLCALYSWTSKIFLLRRLLDSNSGVHLSRKQCLLLICAGSLSHFFLDHLFEENGHSSMYIWILSTGWWASRAPVNLDSVIVVGSLCILLLAGFVYLNRNKSAKTQSFQSLKLILSVACLYSLWCASQIYWVVPRRPAVGEEADLGVIIFLACFFFLPHCLCLLSMHPRSSDFQLLPL